MYVFLEAPNANTLLKGVDEVPYFYPGEDFRRSVYYATVRKIGEQFE
jgi:hypothetical protein